MTTRILVFVFAAVGLYAGEPPKPDFNQSLVNYLKLLVAAQATDSALQRSFSDQQKQMQTQLNIQAQGANQALEIAKQACDGTVAGEGIDLSCKPAEKKVGWFRRLLNENPAVAAR